MIGQMCRSRAAWRFGSASYPLSVSAALGVMSGPISSRISSCRLSLASPLVRWMARGKPSKSVLRWILVENPPRERPSAWPCCPLGAGCRDMRPDHRAIEHLNQMRRRAHLRQGLEERFENAGSAQPPEALPYTVPVAELPWQRPPGNIVDREVGSVEIHRELMTAAAR